MVRKFVAASVSTALIVGILWASTVSQAISEEVQPLSSLAVDDSSVTIEVKRAKFADSDIVVDSAGKARPRAIEAGGWTYLLDFRVRPELEEKLSIPKLTQTGPSRINVRGTLEFRLENPKKPQAGVMPVIVVRSGEQIQTQPGLPDRPEELNPFAIPRPFQSRDTK